MILFKIFVNIFQVYFYVKETLVLSFDHVVLSKGGFLVHKTAFYYSENFVYF